MTFQKILLFIVFTFCTNLIFGQTQKGTWLLKGTGSIGHFQEENIQIPIWEDVDFNIVQVDFQPSIGRFIVNHLATGIDLSFHLQNNNGTFAGYRRDFGMMPYLRYYWFKGRFKMFAQIDYYLGWEWRKEIELTPDFATTNFVKVRNFKTAASGKIGASLFLNNQVSLTAHYTQYFHDDRVNIWFNPEKFQGIEFGVDYFFNKKEVKKQENWIPLVDRYLKKRSYQIGLDINADFNTFTAGRLFWNVFLTDKLLLSNQFETFLERNTYFVKRHFFIGYEPQFQYFIPLRTTTFLTPFVSGSFGVSNIKQDDGDVNTDGYGYFLAGGLAISQFLNRGKVDFGVACRRHYDDRIYQRKKKWDADVFLKMEFFLSPNFSLSAAVRTNVEGVARKAANEPEQFGMTDYMRFGFRYFVATPSSPLSPPLQSN